MKAEDPAPTIAAQLTRARLALSEASDNPRLDAELLLGHVLQKNRTHLIAWPERRLSCEQLARFSELLARRANGEPAAYLTGCREFWSLELETTPDTLIPRPETELLVERALALLPADRPSRVADLGTGSGAIAIAIASERPLVQMVASDISDAALAVARRNIARHGLSNAETRQGDWFTALAGLPPFDLVVSNPPYIERSDPHLAENGLPWEPLDALVSGDDGLDAIRLLAASARSHLSPGGWLLLEHGYNQGSAVRQLLQAGGFTQIQTHRDLAGQERLTEGRLPDAR